MPSWFCKVIKRQSVEIITSKAIKISVNKDLILHWNEESRARNQLAFDIFLPFFSDQFIKERMRQYLDTTAELYLDGSLYIRSSPLSVHYPTYPRTRFAGWLIATVSSIYVSGVRTSVYEATPDF